MGEDIVRKGRSRLRCEASATIAELFGEATALGRTPRVYSYKPETRRA
jgi:hypothetical protein